MTRSQSVGSELRNGLALSQPALLTSTSIRPNRRFTCATITSTDSCEVTSVCMPTASPPIATAVSLAADSLMSVTTTVAPSAASFSAIARPMPGPAPVTIATLVSSFPTSPTFPKIAASTGRSSAEQGPGDDELGDLRGPVADLQPDDVAQPLAEQAVGAPESADPSAPCRPSPRPGSAAAWRPVVGLVARIGHARREPPQFLAVELVVGVETEAHSDPGNLVADGSVPVDVSVEVGLALLSERRSALEAFRRGGEQVQRRHGEVAQTRLVVGVGVEGLLEEPDGGRALVRDLGCPLLGFLHQLVGGHHLVDQTHLLGRSRVVHPTPEPDLPGLLLADHPGEVGRTEAGVERAHLRPRLAEEGVLAGDRHVAEHVQHVAATDGHAIDPGDDGLRDIADQLVQVADLEHAALARAVVAGLGALLDVAAGAEGLLAGAGEDDRLNLPVRPGGAERLDHLLDRLRAEGVVALGTVDRDDRGRAVDRVGDVVKVKGRHPGPLLATPQERGEDTFT